MAVNERLLALMLRRPSVAEAVSRVIAFAETNPEKTFEWHTVRVDGAVLKRLFLLEVLDVVYRSRSYTEYRVRDIDEMKETLAEYAEMMEGLTE